MLLQLDLLNVLEGNLLPKERSLSLHRNIRIMQVSNLKALSSVVTTVTEL